MKKNNGVERIAKMGGCDGVFVECRGEDDMPAVSPYNTKTGEWMMGLTLLTSWDEIFAAKIKKVTKNDPEDFANKKLKEFYSFPAPKKPAKKK